MNKRQKIIISAAVIATLALVTVGVLAFWSLQRKAPEAPKSDNTAETTEQKMQAGRKLETAGKTEEALKYYKEASELCEKSDHLCNANTDMKVMMIEQILKAEKERKANTPQPPKQNKQNIQ